MAESSARASAEATGSSKRHVYPCRVRWSDVDSYGHVNNVKYFEYFQEARIQLMMAQGRELGAGRHLVVAQVDVDYRLSVRPTALTLDHPLARMGGDEMGIVYSTDIGGRTSATTMERGPRPTAAAMLRDLIDLATSQAGNSALAQGTA